MRTQCRLWLGVLATLLLPAYSALTVGQSAAMYKCTKPGGETAFSDRPCTVAQSVGGGAASGKSTDGGYKQEVIRQRSDTAAPESAGALTALCDSGKGKPLSDEALQPLKGEQLAAVRQVLSGLAMSDKATLQAARLQIDARGSVVICVPQERAVGALPAGRVTIVDELVVDREGTVRRRSAGGDAQNWLCDAANPLVRLHRYKATPQQTKALTELRRSVPEAVMAVQEEDWRIHLCVPKMERVYAAFVVEANGRLVTLRPSGRVKVYNDANDPMTLAGRCSSTVTSCFQPGTPGHSLDQCFENAPTCPGERLDPAAACCPQTCKDAYRKERSAGTDPLSASLKVLYGDSAGAVSCVPGMPRTAQRPG